MVVVSDGGTIKKPLRIGSIEHKKDIWENHSQNIKCKRNEKGDGFTQSPSPKRG